MLSDPDTDPILDDFRNLEELEKRYGIKAGTPIMDNGVIVDTTLIQYFTSGTWRSYELKSQKTYAPLLKNFFEYMDVQRHKRPIEATTEDIALWKTLRTDYSVNPEHAVSLTSWVKERAALNSFFEWAASPARGLCSFNPMSELPRGREEATAQRRPASASEQAELGVRFVSKSQRSYRGKWISPATYRGWRDVGFRGYTLVPGSSPGKYRMGEPEATYRGRNKQRNVAWCDLAYLTGMRLTEQSYLLLPELPPQMTSDLVEVGLGGGITKYRKPRLIVEPPTAAMGVWEYTVGERQDAVARANRRGVYEDGDWIRVTGSSMRRGQLYLRWGSGEYRMAADLKPEIRLRLLHEVGGRWEPLALWLTEGGTPMTSGAWSTVLERASDRYVAETRRVGAAAMTVSPHCLRFSYALLYLIALHQRIDAALGPAPDGPYDSARYDRAYRRVQAQLGHASITTAKETYLEAVVDMRDDDLLSGAAGDISATIEALATRSDLVRADAE